MLKYLRVYKEFIKLSFSEATTYRAHFILLIFMDLSFYASTLLTADFLFEHVQTIGVWGEADFFLFLCFILAVDHLHMTFVSENFWVLSRQIRTGELDYVLLRPVGLLFNVLLKHIRPASMINFVITWPLLIYACLEAQISCYFYPLLPMLLLLALSLLVAIEVIIVSFMFYTVESFGINFLRIQLQRVSRWPDFVYHHLFQKVFTLVLPVLLIASAPSHFLISGDWTHFGVLLLANLLTWLVAIKVFAYALKSYESASS